MALLLICCRIIIFNFCNLTYNIGTGKVFLFFSSTSFFSLFFHLMFFLFLSPFLLSFFSSWHHTKVLFFLLRNLPLVWQIVSTTSHHAGQRGRTRSQPQPPILLVKTPACGQQFFLLRLCLWREEGIHKRRDEKWVVLNTQQEQPGESRSLRQHLSRLPSSIPGEPGRYPIHQPSRRLCSCPMSIQHGVPHDASDKESACQCRGHRIKCGFDPWVKKVSWSRKWHPTPIFLPAKSHGQRSLAGYCPWGSKSCI